LARMGFFALQDEPDRGSSPWVRPFRLPNAAATVFFFAFCPASSPFPRTSSAWARSRNRIRLRPGVRVTDNAQSVSNELSLIRATCPRHRGRRSEKDFQVQASPTSHKAKMFLERTTGRRQQHFKATAKPVLSSGQQPWSREPRISPSLLIVLITRNGPATRSHPQAGR